MSDWVTRTLGEWASVVSGGTPARDNPDYWGGEYLWVTPTDITACRTNTLSRTAESITKSGLLSSSAKLIPEGTILLTSRASIGLSKIAGHSLCTNQGFKNLVPGKAIDGLFLFYQTQRIRSEFERFAAGSTFLEINKRDTERIRLSAPAEITHQRRVASILVKVDVAIEKTESLIEKYQHIKAGLMHDLFTRGVLPNGQLRPRREEAPELYQNTAIGWIPSDWRVKKCAELCSRICVGIVIQPSQYYVESGVPALRSANVRENGITLENVVYISPEANSLLSKSQIRAGDIVSVRTGYPGTSAVVPLDLHGFNCIDIIVSTPNSEVDSEYLCEWINSSNGKGQVLRAQGGAAQQHFNVGEMQSLLVALPQYAEQIAIKERLRAVQAKISTELVNMRKLQAQKSGLMQDLLTGKVPVPVPEHEATDG